MYLHYSIIILALCSYAKGTDYAQNYAGIVRKTITVKYNLSNYELCWCHNYSKRYKFIFLKAVPLQPHIIINMKNFVRVQYNFVVAALAPAAPVLSLN